MLDWVLGLDTDAFLYLNSKNSPFWDDIMLWISGKYEWIPLYVILLIVLIRNDLSWRVVITLLFVALTVLLCDQLSVLIKDLVGRERPCHDAEFTNHFVSIGKKGDCHCPGYGNQIYNAPGKSPV